MISAARAARLLPKLERLRGAARLSRRLESDPVSLVHAYRDVRDQEVAGLFCASLAYGRVGLFLPVLARLLSAMGPSPGGFCLALPRDRDLRPFEGLVYRFNTGADLAFLAWAIGDALRSHGSLEALFLAQLREKGDLRGALAGFTAWLRARDGSVVTRALGEPRALHHLLPDALRGGASKRLLLYLRWMVRGPDGVDLGAWPGLDPARLIIPLDTHVARMAQNLGLTRRKDLSWRTAEQVTASLRLLDPRDPVKYDFALCHFGMSGSCPARRRVAICRGCVLQGDCAIGARLVKLSLGPQLESGSREALKIGEGRG